MVAVSSESAKRALLERLIDDASLFPPAQLPLVEALRVHFRHRESAYSWVGGRFVLPISRADEFGGARRDAPPIALSVILDGVNASDERTIVAALDRVAQLRELRGVTVPSMELVVAADPGPVAQRIASRWAERPAADEITLWLESPYRGGWTTEPDAALALIAAARAGAPPTMTIGAKVRCGGAAAENVPSPDDLAAFIVAAQRHGVPWKATAGLHHPVRTLRDGTTMHGFLNVFIAGIALHADALPAERVATVIAEEDPRAFVVDPTHIAWRDARVDADAVAAARTHCVAFGSCSFAEPVNDLRELGILS
jgi:hypothetical protein